MDTIDRYRWGGTGAGSTPDVLSLERVYLRDGYAPSGRYFGNGLALYHVTDEYVVDYYIRAADRQHARAMVRAHYPNARVNR